MSLCGCIRNAAHAQLVKRLFARLARSLGSRINYMNCPFQSWVIILHTASCDVAKTLAPSADDDNIVGNLFDKLISGDFCVACFHASTGSRNQTSFLFYKTSPPPTRHIHNLHFDGNNIWMIFRFACQDISESANWLHFSALCATTTLTFRVDLRLKSFVEMRSRTGTCMHVESASFLFSVVQFESMFCNVYKERHSIGVRSVQVVKLKVRSNSLKNVSKNATLVTMETTQIHPQMAMRCAN